MDLYFTLSVSKLNLHQISKSFHSIEKQTSSPLQQMDAEHCFTFFKCHNVRVEYKYVQNVDTDPILKLNIEC
jgi:hypothetical protein